MTLTHPVNCRVRFAIIPLKSPLPGGLHPLLQIFCKIRQNFLLLARLTMFKPRKMSKMLKFLPCRADFMPPLCYNTNKWGIAARRAPVVLTTQDGSKEYL